MPPLAVSNCLCSCVLGVSYLGWFISLATYIIKVEHQRLVGELRPLEIPTWKWDSISMDFIMGLPLTASKKNAIWVIVDRLTKSTHFVAIHDSWNVNKLPQIYVREMIQLYGIPKDIISDRDSRFQSQF